jgi:ferritin-like metal-binding protein YciE
MWERDILELSNLLQYIIDQYTYEISQYNQWKQRANSIYEEKLHKILEKLLTALNLVSQIIIFEIALQKLSLQDRQIYGSLCHTAKEILARTDLDEIRKGQIIHDLAAQLEFNSEQVEQYELADH